MKMASHRVLLFTACLLAVGVSTASAWPGLGDLLAGRTATMASAAGEYIVYHGADGRLASITSAPRQQRSGHWWIDDDGRYCYRFDDVTTASCLFASLDGDRVRLRSAGTEVLVTRLVPGDVEGLVGDVDQAACQCRLHGRKRVGSGDG